jgi:HEAT repeat protein
MNRLLLPVGVLCSALCAPLSAVAGDVKYEGQTVQQWTTALTNPDAKVRRKAAYALGQIGLEAREAVPALTKALADRYLEVAWYAADALGRIGPGAAPATEALVRVIEETPGDAVLRRTATIALGRIGPDAKSALPILAKLVKSDDAETRVAAAVALGQIARDASSLPLLIAELKPTGGPGPLAAALALRSFESEQAAKALIGVLENPDADLRRAAIETLGDGGANSIGPLVTAAGD